MRKPFFARAAALAALLLALAPMAAGTAQAAEPHLTAEGDTVIATVGDRTITLREYRESWIRLFPNERPQAANHEDRARIFLDNMITRHVLAIEAMKDTRPLSLDKRKELDGLEQTLLQNELYFQEVQKRSEVDAVDIDLFRKEASRILELKWYAFETKEQAQAWYTRLTAGTPMSRLEEAAVEGGEGAPTVEQGFVRREGLTDETARVLFNLEIGRISPPLPQNEFWSLFQLVGWTQRPGGVDLTDEEEILETARRYREPEIRAQYQRELREVVDLEYNFAGIDTLLNRFLLLPPRTTYSSSGVPSFNLAMAVPPAVESDSLLLLATTNEGDVMGRDLLRFYSNTAPMHRAEVRTRESLMALVDRVGVDPEIARRASALDVSDHPRVKAKLERNLEGAYVERMVEDSVTAQIDFSWENIEAFYDQYAEYYDLPERIQIWYIIVREKAKADSLLEVIQNDPDVDVAELAALHSIETGSGSRGGVTDVLNRGSMESVEFRG